MTLSVIYCGRKGHIPTVCRKKAAGRPKNHSGRDDARRSVKRIDADQRTEDSDSEEFRICQLGTKSTKPLQVEVRVNDKPLCMELDTGAAVSIVSESHLKALHPSISLQPSEVLLQTYTGSE